MSMAFESADTVTLHKFSCEANANVLVRQGRKITCMRLLGETVAQLRAANRWTLQDLAARVRQQGARTVKYQHIQNLESKPDTSPRYLPELAAAFGKTVEELRSWSLSDPAYGHHGITSAHAVAEESWAFEDPPLSHEEQQLIDDYRTCKPDVQRAVRILLAAAKR